MLKRITKILAVFKRVFLVDGEMKTLILVILKVQNLFFLLFFLKDMRKNILILLLSLLFFRFIDGKLLFNVLNHFCPQFYFFVFFFVPNTQNILFLYDFFLRFLLQRTLVSCFDMVCVFTMIEVNTLYFLKKIF